TGCGAGAGASRSRAAAFHRGTARASATASPPAPASPITVRAGSAPSSTPPRTYPAALAPLATAPKTREGPSAYLGRGPARDQYHRRHADGSVADPADHPERHQPAHPGHRRDQPDRQTGPGQGAEQGHAKPSVAEVAVG